MHGDWGYSTSRDHLSVRRRFPVKARTHLKCILLLSTIRSNADFSMASSRWPPSTALPWQPLLDSMASADKEEEVPAPEKAS